MLRRYDSSVHIYEMREVPYILKFASAERSINQPLAHIRAKIEYESLQAYLSL
jgi:hypothetical protein